MIPFRERNPVVVGAVSLSVIGAMLFAAFRADDLPIVGGGDTYYATFSEAGGLKVDDEVRVAGVRVGKVGKISLDGDLVKVEFKIDGEVELGEDTTAAIKVKTILGQMFLALDPGEQGSLDEGATIENGTSPYDVVEAFTGLAETSSQIDTDQLTEAMRVLADLTANTPDEFKAALAGVSALSRNVAKRDAELNTLLKNLNTVAGVLDERDEEIIALMRDADVLFQALVKRRDAIHDLLVATSDLGLELTRLVKESRADLKPALEHTESVLRVLNKNQENLDDSLRLMAPFYRVFTNTLGTGPWFDTYITNLPPLPALNRPATGEEVR